MTDNGMTPGISPGRRDQEAGAIGSDPAEAGYRAMMLALAARDAEIVDLARRATDAALAATEARALVRVLEGEIAERFRELATLSRLHLDAEARHAGSEVTPCNAGGEVTSREDGSEALACNAGTRVTRRDARIRELESQYDLIRSSTSWRLTAPLRRAVLWFRPHRPNKNKKADPSK